jgi:SAM-dependent MidA family methyltransferase
VIPAWLTAKLQESPLPFERFMELALYHPTHGYYTRRIQDVGRRGDFSTTVTLSPALGCAIAHWIRTELKFHQARPPFHLIEAGPGNGALARTVLESLPWLIRRQVRLHLVEISPPLRALQEKTLRKHARHIRWHTSIEDALKEIGGQDSRPALLYSNELFDAFPIRVFRCADAAIQELHLTHRDDHLEELWLPVANPPDSLVFSFPSPENQRLEVSNAAQHWLSTAAGHLDHGSILTIDYGGSCEEIYHRRPQGTVRAYFQHQCLTGPAVYQNIGYQDLTADVLFDDLEAWGTTCGLKTVRRLTQATFLAPFLEEGAEDSFISSPHGAGSAFKVLIQRKG